MAKGLAPWNPGGSKKYLDEVLEVIMSSEDYWPLSQRYWLYRLMAKKGWIKVDEYQKSKAPKKYQHLCTRGKNLNLILDRGRRSGLIPWEAVSATRGCSSDPYNMASGYAMAQHVIALVNSVRFDRQRGQSRQVALWCETEGLVPLLKPVAHYYGATMLAGKGFDVIGRKHDFAEKIATMGDVLILHMGDMDRSGHTVKTSLDEDLRAFISDMGGRMEMKRIALTESQVQAYALEYACVEIDAGLNAGNHGKGFDAAFECQLEAMDAPDIQEVARAAFRASLDMDLFDERVENEASEREWTGRLLAQEFAI